LNPGSGSATPRLPAADHPVVSARRLRKICLPFQQLKRLFVFFKQA